MARNARYRVPFRRRREGKTNYHLRRRLVRGKTTRAVVRLTNNHCIVQFVDAEIHGDKTLSSTHSRELQTYKWLGSTSNVPSAYLTGYLAGVKAQNAKEGLRRLYESSDTTIVVPNEKLIEIVPDLSLKEAFLVADEILIRAVTGLTELINRPGDVNVDFADVRRVLGEGGAAIIGLGESSSHDNRAQEAVEDALSNPLLEVDIRTAKSVLLNITGCGQDGPLYLPTQQNLEQ